MSLRKAGSEGTVHWTLERCPQCTRRSLKRPGIGTAHSYGQPRISPYYQRLRGNYYGSSRSLIEGTAPRPLTPCTLANLPSNTSYSRYPLRRSVGASGSGWASASARAPGCAGRSTAGSRTPPGRRRRRRARARPCRVYVRSQKCSFSSSSTSPVGPLPLEGRRPDRAEGDIGQGVKVRLKCMRRPAIPSARRRQTLLLFPEPRPPSLH